MVCGARGGLRAHQGSPCPIPCLRAAVCPRCIQPQRTWLNDVNSPPNTQSAERVHTAWCEVRGSGPLGLTTRRQVCFSTLST